MKSDHSLIPVWMEAIPPVRSLQAPPSPSLISPVWKPASRILPAPVEGRQHEHEPARQGKDKKALYGHMREVGLGREALDRLDQVLIRVTVRSEDLAEERDHRERVLPVDPARKIVMSGREVERRREGDEEGGQTHEAKSGFVTLPNSMQAKTPPGFSTR